MLLNCLDVEHLNWIELCHFQFFLSPLSEATSDLCTLTAAIDDMLHVLPEGVVDIDQDGGQYYSPVYADHIVNYLKVSQLPEGGGGGHRPGRWTVLLPCLRRPHR